MIYYGQNTWDDDDDDDDDDDGTNAWKVMMELIRIYHGVVHEEMTVLWCYFMLFLQELREGVPKL